jgi:hypothetical protein
MQAFRLRFESGAIFLAHAAVCFFRIPIKNEICALSIARQIPKNRSSGQRYGFLPRCIGIIAARLTDMLHGNYLSKTATFRFNALLWLPPKTSSHIKLYNFIISGIINQ